MRKRPIRNGATNLRDASCSVFCRPEKNLVKKRNEKLQSILLESPHGRFFFQKEIHYTNLKVCAIKKVLCLINEVIFERSLHS